MYPTALDIAADVRSGTRSAVEVLDEHLARIDEREAEIHAFNHVMVDEARSAAEAVDADVAAGQDVGPLAGVPVALKDNMCTRGTPTTCSSKILEGWKPPYDATIVERLKAAGAVIVGKTNLDEFAMGSSTENSAFGPTRNPHDTSRVPGGSSGGSSAAVAAGFAPLSLGSDTGGSIRQPAALCGVVGMKPTYGAVSRYGLIAFASSLDQIGPFANTVADSAQLLEVIGGHDPRDSTSIPEPFPSLLDHLEDGVDGLRIGVISELSGGGLDGFEPDVLARTTEAADALSAAGAKVEIGFGALHRRRAVRLLHDRSGRGLLEPGPLRRRPLRPTSRRTEHRIDDGRFPHRRIRREVKRRIMLGTYALSAGYWDAFYGRAQRVRTLMIREFEEVYRDFDLLLSPTSPCVAFPFGAKADPLTMYLNDVCTIPSNLTGQPAISVPFGTDNAGLPIGVQVLAPLLGEQTMYRAARALEEVAP